MGVDPATLDAKAVKDYAGKAEEQTVVAFLLAIIPDTFVGAFTGGQVLPVLFVAVVFGLSVASLKDSAAPVVRALQVISEVFFRLVNMLMRFAPIGAFGAFAFTVGKFGVASTREPRKFDRNLLSHVGVIRSGRTRRDSAPHRVLAVGVFALSQRRDLAGDRYEFLGSRIATSDGETRACRLREIRRRVGRARRLLLQSRRHQYPDDARRAIHRPSDRDRVDAVEQLLLLLVAIVSSKGAAGVTGAGFITSGGDARRRADRSGRRNGADFRYRSFHVRMPRSHEFHRQCGRHRRRRENGRSNT
jgi:aerobic C4-dicarboxylate transport protein